MSTFFRSVKSKTMRVRKTVISMHFCHSHDFAFYDAFKRIIGCSFSALHFALLGTRVAKVKYLFPRKRCIAIKNYLLADEQMQIDKSQDSTCTSSSPIRLPACKCNGENLLLLVMVKVDKVFQHSLLVYECSAQVE